MNIVTDKPADVNPASPKRCHKHDWAPLYHCLPHSVSIAHALAFSGPVACDPDKRVCRLCGLLGFVPRGYTRGGGHTTRPYQYQEFVATPELFAGVALWNAAVSAWAAMDSEVAK